MVSQAGYGRDLAFFHLLSFLIEWVPRFQFFMKIRLGVHKFSQRRH